MASSEPESSGGLPTTSNSPSPSSSSPQPSSSTARDVRDNALGSRSGSTSNPSPRSSENISGHVRITATIRSQSQPPGMAGNVPQQPTNNVNNNNEFQQPGQNLFHMRDRLFLALFFRVSLIYARAFPKTLRRFIEFCLLMQSIILLFILGYIHVVYTQTPITCLSEYRDSWPKDGILRVEITTESSVDYDITKSYKKEERLRQRAAASQMGQYDDNFIAMMLTADTVFLDKVVSAAGQLISSAKPKKQDTTGEANDMATASEEILKPSEISTVDNTMYEGGPETSSSPEDNSERPALKNRSEQEIILDKLIPGKAENMDGEQMELANDDTSILPSFAHTATAEENSVSYVGSDGAEVDVTDPDSIYFNKTSEEIEELKSRKTKSEEEIILKSSVSDFEMFANSVWLQDQAYIVEYALEYGFLRLSPETRQKLNIPVKIVALDPTKEACFGDTFSRFLLDNFLGYDDILMASIKNLAESEENKGYLRNVVTGEQFRFVPMWMARSAYIPSLLIMLVFTVSISMLLRYSHHQIFVFIVDLLNNIEGTGAIQIPAAPLFTVILALVGMEAIMSEFFNDTSTAFYVILIVWIADQYDSVAIHLHISRTYWVRFFYLYHFAFYAYHYRFNGQYGGLALLVSWSFIQHSMVYFYHHYELPTILRQARGGGDDRNISRSPTPTAVPPAPARSEPGSNNSTAQLTVGGDAQTNGQSSSTRANQLSQTNRNSTPEICPHLQREHQPSSSHESEIGTNSDSLIDNSQIVNSPTVVTTPPISSIGSATDNAGTAVSSAIQSTSSNLAFGSLQGGHNSSRQTDGLDTSDWTDSDDEPD